MQITKTTKTTKNIANDDDDDGDDDDDVDADDNADFFRHATILIRSLHPHRLLQSLHEGYVAGPLDRSENIPLTVIGLEWFGLDRIGWRTINSFLFLLSRCMPPARSQTREITTETSDWV